jgi:hypothetical protein
MADINNENKQELSRRAVFQVLGAAPVMVAAARPALAQMADHHAPASPKGPYQRKVFDDHQWRTVCVLCDLIIPADERSVSATRAGVPEFIDDWIAFRKEQDGEDKLEAQILGGLMWLDRESHAKFGKQFADAAEDQQKKLLDRIAWPARAANEDHAWVEFFNRFRDLTVGGFFSSKAGVADLPYLGNTAVAEWKGCDPQVWAILEDRMKNGYKGVGGEAKPWA